MRELAELERALVARLDANKIKIPPYPAIATKLEQLSRQPRSSMTELATVVSSDPTLAATVLGRAHSAAHGGARVATLHEALARIGMQQLIEMALATGLGNGAVANGPLAELRRDNWRRALLGAHLARMLAANRGIAAETAYLAGLLYELGAVVATCGLEDIAKEHALPALPEPEWRALVAALEGRFGRVIATRWNLPPELADVVAHDAAPASALGDLLALGAQIVARLDGSPTAGLVAALADIAGLSEIERSSIGSVVQEVVKSMGAYTVATPPPPRVVIPAAKPADDAFPAAFDVTAHKQRGRARTIAATSLVFEVAQPIAPSWLVELTLHTADPFSMLANVRSCTKQGAAHSIDVKPFALEGAALEQWVQLLIDARLAVR
ncbi:MAG TPA: HDOD domain-containing protein [Kofleriaceae bacterium]|nr:HDOD domain-containing protein [Kofleriaceae bacterium]